MGEKYLVSGNGMNAAAGGYYILLSNSTLYAWDNVSLTSSEKTGFVASLGLSAYEDPSVLINAQPPYNQTAATTETSLDLQAPALATTCSTPTAPRKNIFSAATTTTRSTAATMS